ncbi:FMN reductase [Acuticoccus sp. M5D2P5]|uniref:FMN reductase n=1 Tax=Acuticoccus kalidii TaxID=2910977 RepID=UPI001F2A13F2|nr:FMN reductase [Acuticoccus kalidii]MCF3934014.1 FMN reductase [Acuticoccus kalidii]
MMHFTLFGLAGSLNRPSRTRLLVEEAVGMAEDRFGVRTSVADLIDIGPSLGGARRLSDLDREARTVVDGLLGADALVVGTPVYKGSYTGLFKHLFDLLDPSDLADKPVLLAATGGGDRHALVVEHQLRPLFGFFGAHSLATAVYASEQDFADGRLVSTPLRERVARAVDGFAPFLPAAVPVAHARAG